MMGIGAWSAWVVVEVGRDVMREVAGGVPQVEPLIRYHRFGDSSINVTVILRAKEFVDRYLIKQQFVKRLPLRFNAEGMVMPFPIRTIAYPESLPDAGVERVAGAA